MRVSYFYCLCSSLSLTAPCSVCSHYFLVLRPSVMTFRGTLWAFWRWIKCFLLSLCYFKSPRNRSLRLSPSVGYMWACLHDRRNAKSGPDHNNMPCVHNLHEIHIHSWHACTRNSFSLFFFPCVSHASRSVDVLCSESLSNEYSGVINVSCFLHNCLLSSLFLPINALGSHHAAAPRKSTAAVCLKRKKQNKTRGSTSFAPARESKREGNVSLAPML